MIQPVNALTPKVLSRGSKEETKNPVNRNYEKKLAILNAGGISVVAGALTSLISRSYTASWKNSAFIGAGASLITMMFVCPRFLYKSGIYSYQKEKEMDVFTKEKEVQSKLLSDVNNAIDNKSVDISGKLEQYSKIVAQKSK